MRESTVSPETTRPDPSKVLALARAVMVPGRRRVTLLNENNEADGWVSLEEAVRTGRAFFVRYREDLLCLDCDSEPTAAAGSEIADDAVERGFPSVEWASGRPDHRQVVVRIPDPTELSKWKERAKGLGIDVRRDSRPPLSPHRLGLPVALIRPETAQEALAALGSPSVPGQPLDRPRASAATWRRIRWGDSTAESGSEVGFRIACGLAGRSVPAEQGYWLLLDERNVGGEALRKRFRQGGERAARRWWFDHVWPTAEKYVAENPPLTSATDARLAIVRLREEADRWKWSTVELPGGYLPSRVTGSSVRRGLEGVLDIASTAGTIRPYIGERHLADVAGFGSRNTTRKALLALTTLGWLKRETPGKGREASTYRLVLDGPRRNSSRLEKTSLLVVGTRGSDPQIVANGETVIEQPTEHQPRLRQMTTSQSDPQQPIENVSE